MQHATCNATNFSNAYPTSFRDVNCMLLEMQVLHCALMHVVIADYLRLSLRDACCPRITEELRASELQCAIMRPLAQAVEELGNMPK
jgi:hypothetical protein